MGTLTRSQLEDEVGAFFGDRSDLDSARYTRWLNLAQTRIARLKDWDELKTTDETLQTAASTKTVTAPTDIRKIYSLRLIDGSNSRKLTRRQQMFFDKNIPYPERYAEQRPTEYIYWNGQFEFYPVPNAIYTLHLRYVKWPTAFTIGSDVASELDEKDDALIMLTVSWGHLSLRNNQDATYYWRIYQNMINEAAGEDVEGPDIQRTPDLNSGNAAGDYWKNPFITSMSQVD